MIRSVAVLLGLCALLAAAPSEAAENELDFWFHPGVSKDIGNKSFVEVETQHRAFGGGADNLTVARLWVGREVVKGVTVTLGVHRGWEGEARENRLMQQVSYPLAGKLKGRTRLEQRFQSDEPRTAWRLRQRVGLSVPLGQEEDGWEFATNVEGFFTLRAAAADGQTGLTGIRTFAGVEREFERVEVSVGYTRQQNVRRGRADRIGHAPTLALTFKL